MEQLDIFDDSRDRVLINWLAEALLQGRASLAASAADDLRDEFPADRHLPAATVLIEALEDEAAAGVSTLEDGAQALAARAHLAQHVVPAAHTLLGSADAEAWLALRWQALAHRARHLAYHNESAPVHAAALWLQGAAWPQAAAAVEGIESWRRRPTPLAWMAQARWHLEGLDATWPLLAELAWLAPARVPALLAQLPDRVCATWSRRFERDFEDATTPEGWAWWPAWLLIEQPLLSAPLAGAQTTRDTAPERTFRLMRSLLHLERQGRHHDLIDQRRQLRELNEALFAAYMATR